MRRALIVALGLAFGISVEATTACSGCPEVPCPPMTLTIASATKIAAVVTTCPSSFGDRSATISPPGPNGGQCTLDIRLASGFELVSSVTFRALHDDCCPGTFDIQPPFLRISEPVADAGGD